MKRAFAFPTRLLMVLALTGIVFALAPPARAAPVPDSLRLEELRRNSKGWNRCRVLTNRNDYEFRKLEMDSLGVIVSEPPRRPAIIVDPSLQPEAPKRIAWAEIERIEATRSHSVSGFFQGAIVGGIVGVAGAALVVANGGGGEGAGVVPLAMIQGGILIGGVTGAMLASSSGWKPLYP
jgi:hypothetical protein